RHSHRGRTYSWRGRRRQSGDPPVVGRAGLPGIGSAGDFIRAARDHEPEPPHYCDARRCHGRRTRKTKFFATEPHAPDGRDRIASRLAIYDIRYTIYATLSSRSRPRIIKPLVNRKSYIANFYRNAFGFIACKKRWNLAYEKNSPCHW